MLTVSVCLPIKRRRRRRESAIRNSRTWLGRGVAGVRTVCERGGVREGVERPPIVGGDEELAAIEELVSRLERGTAGLVLSGPAGIGKTRLWMEAVRSARTAGVRVLTTRPAGADTGVGFGGLRDLVGEWAT